MQLNTELDRIEAMKLVVIITTILLVGCGRDGFERGRVVTAAQAVSIAKSFVRANGYTTHWPSRLHSLVPESVEFLPEHEWREFRHDTLHAKPYGYSRGRKDGAPGWSVVFQHKLPAFRHLGRAVTMDERGAAIRIEHEDFILEYVEVKLP